MLLKILEIVVWFFIVVFEIWFFLIMPYLDTRSDETGVDENKK